MSGPSGTSSARPDRLLNYSRTLQANVDAMRVMAGRLQDAMGQYLANCEGEQVVPAAGTADGVRRAAARVEALARWLAEVANAFVQADQRTSIIDRLPALGPDPLSSVLFGVAKGARMAGEEDRVHHASDEHLLGHLPAGSLAGEARGAARAAAGGGAPVSLRRFDVEVPTFGAKAGDPVGGQLTKESLLSDASYLGGETRGFPYATSVLVAPSVLKGAADRWASTGGRPLDVRVSQTVFSQVPTVVSTGAGATASDVTGPAGGLAVQGATYWVGEKVVASVPGMGPSPGARNWATMQQYLTSPKATDAPELADDRKRRSEEMAAEEFEKRRDPGGAFQVNWSPHYHGADLPPYNPPPVASGG